MANWDGIQSWLRENYELDNDERDWTGIVFDIDEERTQKVVVSPFSAHDVSWIEIKSPVCSESELSFKAALKKNSELAIGALYLENGKYYLSYSLQVGDLSSEEIELPLRAIALEADSLEQDHAAGDEH
jgi:hypothetical protein